MVLSGAGATPGGVSSHVNALRDALDASDDAAVGLVSPADVIRRQASVRRANIVHFHVSSPSGWRLKFLRLLVELAGPSRSVVTFHHGQLGPFYESRWSDRRRVIRLARRIRAVVCLDDSLFEFLRRHAPSAHTELSTPWVTMTSADESLGLDTPHPIVSSEGRPVDQWIVTSGYESEIYRFEHVVSLAACVGAGVALCTYGPRDDAYLRRVQLCARDRGVPLRWFRDLSSEQFRAVVARAALYLRDTTSDSFGLAVAEALALGVPAAATPVARRPRGTLIIPLGDDPGAVRIVRAALRERRVIESEPLMELARQSLASVRRAYGIAP